MYEGGFAGVYDAFMEDADYRSRADYILRILADGGIRDGILLDLGCGTGTLTALLADAGYDLIAADVSADMLARAREKLAGYGGRILFLLQDMRELDLYGTVRAAVCSLDGMNHLLTESDLLEAFRRVSLFTEPGGLFVFDLNTVYKHREILGDNCFVYENEDSFLVWQNELDPETDTVTMLLDVFEETPDGTYRRDGDEIAERAYPLPVIRSLLEQAGFSAVRFYADGTFEAPGEETARVCAVAVK